MNKENGMRGYFPLKQVALFKYASEEDLVRNVTPFLVTSILGLNSLPIHCCSVVLKFSLASMLVCIFGQSRLQNIEIFRIMAKYECIEKS